MFYLFEKYFNTYLLPTLALHPDEEVHFVGNVAGVFQDRLRLVAQKHDIKIVSIEDLIHYQLKKGDLIERIEERKVKTHYGEFDFFAFKETTTPNRFGNLLGIKDAL